MAILMEPCKTLPLPRCWICRKPVDSLLATGSILEATTILIACCHGQEERVSLSFMDVVNADRIELDWAFRPTQPVIASNTASPASRALPFRAQSPSPHRR